MRLRTWAYHFREAIGSVRTNGMMAIASVSTVAVSLLVLAIFLLLAVNLDNVALVLEQQVEVRAYASNQASPAALKSLEGQIRRVEGVAEVRFVSSEEALRRLKALFGDRADLLEGVEELNALRPSFEVRVRQPEQVRAVAQSIRSLPGVEALDFKEELVERLFDATRALRVAGIGLVLILAAATVFIIHNTIRLTVFARRREIGIMKLVGATDSFIRSPFMIEGVLFGLAGALVAGFLAWRLYDWVAFQAHRTLPFLPVLAAEPLVYNVAAALLLLGGLLGGLGSAWAVRRYLRV